MGAYLGSSSVAKELERLALLHGHSPNASVTAARESGRNGFTQTIDAVLAFVKKYLPPVHWLSRGWSRSCYSAIHLALQSRRCHPLIYSSAIPDSKKEGTLRTRCRHRPVQYLNNILEQDHRAIKRRVNAKQAFREFQAARRTIQGYEAIHMIRKGQARWVAGDDLLRQIQFIDSLFDLAA